MKVLIKNFLYLRSIFSLFIFFVTEIDRMKLTNKIEQFVPFLLKIFFLQKYQMNFLRQWLNQQLSTFRNFFSV